jgi:nucleotide-binding universal stress UspA family protein
MRVAVTTDFSGRSREAFGIATSLTAKLSAELLLVHHAQPSIFPKSLEVEKFYSSLEAKLSELTTDENRLAGVGAKPMLVRGGNIRSFAEALERENVDLLVMATHGRTGVKRFLLGSFTERAIRFCHCSVIVCHTSEQGESSTTKFEPRRMLVAYDFSPQSRVAVNIARRWARSFGAKIRLLHVVDSECGVTGFEVELYKNWHEYHQEKKKDADKILRQMVVEEWQDTETEIQVNVGHPVLDILSQAEDFAADLIVMGTHGGSLLERYLLGSVAEKVVRKADRPVFLVRESQRAPDGP